LDKILIHFFRSENPVQSQLLSSVVNETSRYSNRHKGEKMDTYNIEAVHYNVNVAANQICLSLLQPLAVSLLEANVLSGKRDLLHQH